jgi:glycosyltransferase involved in cell wall biosynthesis
MSQKNLLTVSAILRDEEGFLPEFLDMILPYCDELILVDTGSTDGSLEILKKHSLTYHTLTWKDDFSQARNFALSQASGKWILSLDIDERLRAEDLIRLRKLLSTSHEIAYSLSCISLKTLDWKSDSLEIHSVNDTNTFVRLFKNGYGIKFQNPIHETVVPSLEAQNHRFSQIDIKVYHLGYAGSRYDEKIRRNKTLLDQHFQSMENDPSFVYYYAQSHWNGDHEVLDLLLRAFDRSAGNLRIFLAESIYGWLMEFPSRPKVDQKNEVDDWEKIVSGLNPSSPMLWLRKARMAYVARQESEALRWYEQIRTVLHQVSEVQFFRAEILYNLGFLYSCKQRFVEALSCYDEYESIFGNDPLIFHQVLKINGVLGKLEVILDCARTLPEGLERLTNEKKAEVRKIINHFCANNQPELVEKVESKLQGKN